MYTITHLYQIVGNQCVDIDITDLTIEQIRTASNTTALTTRYLAEVSRTYIPDTGVTPITEILGVINLSKYLAQESPIVLDTLTSYTDLAAQLTDQKLYMYKDEIPDFTDAAKALIYANCVASSEFDISYTTLASPNERNIKSQRWRLTDLVITKNLSTEILDATSTTVIKKDINFANCIASVNGIISRPIVYEDELYIKDGATLTKANTDMDLPSIVLLDFSYLGNVTLVPFSDCYIHNKSQTQWSDDMLSRREKKNTATPENELEFVLPKNISLMGKTIFPVIAHSLYFNDVVTVSSNRTLILPTNVLPIRNSLLKKAYYEEHTHPYTATTLTDVTVDEYISSEMSKENHYGAFFIVIDTSKVFIKTTPIHHYCMYTFDGKLNEEGLLFNKTTQSFLESTKNCFTSSTEFYSPKIGKHYSLDSLYEKNAYYHDTIFGVTKSQCDHIPRTMVHLGGKDMYLINITKL